MKRISTSLLLLLYTAISYPQRYTGYGRGYDFDDAISFKPSYWIFYIIVGFIIIALPIVLFEKVKSWKGLKSGKYIKIVLNGYEVTTSNKFNKHLEVVKTWNLNEFELLYGDFSYKTRRVNISHKRLEQIICTKDDVETIVNVAFECDYDDFFQRNESFRVAKTNNGCYLLFKKG